MPASFTATSAYRSAWMARVSRASTRAVSARWLRSPCTISWFATVLRQNSMRCATTLPGTVLRGLALSAGETAGVAPLAFLSPALARPSPARSACFAARSALRRGGHLVLLHAASKRTATRRPRRSDPGSPTRCTRSSRSPCRPPSALRPRPGAIRRHCEGHEAIFRLDEPDHLEAFAQRLGSRLQRRHREFVVVGRVLAVALTDGGVEQGGLLRQLCGQPGH